MKVSFSLLFTYVSFLFLVSLKAQAIIRVGNVCDQVTLDAEERELFDLEACKREQNKKLIIVDYESIYHADTHEEWSELEFKLTPPKECEGYLSQTYSLNELIAAVQGSIDPAKIDPALYSVFRAGGKWSNSQKKKFCSHLVASEREILQKIQTLAKDLNLSDQSLTLEINKLISFTLENKPNQWPSDLALKVGLLLKRDQYFAESLSWVNLALSSARPLSDLDVLVLAVSFVEEYNQWVNDGGTDPTSHAFSVVQGALKILEVRPVMSQHDYQVFSKHLLQLLLNTRDLIVRWPISVSELVSDTYFPSYSIVKKIYAKGFVNQVLEQVAKFNGLFRAQNYQGRSSLNFKSDSVDLADQLFMQGFYGYEGSCNGSFQHTWIHPNDFIVRIKKSKFLKQWEFTLGLVFINPICWSCDLKGISSPVQMVTLSNIKKLNPEVDGSSYLKDFSNPAFNYFGELINFKYNEFLKITVDTEGLVTLMPAFQKFYWADHLDEDDILQYLFSAHHSLSRVGHKSEDLSVIRTKYLSSKKL